MELVRPPSVARVLETEAACALVAEHGHAPTTEAIRAAIAECRQKGEAAEPETVAERAAAMLGAEQRSPLRPVWNCTGTILHTNLGRAILSDNAVAAATAAMERPVALEYDLGAGSRGSRDDAVAGLLRELTGAESSLLVNNNAAALMLVLACLARGREVIVSRGELIEIGGAFRLPDLMEAAGAILREVGTTNRTHMRDYASAIGENTALIMKVHPSNFRIEGFTREVTAAELAPLARRSGVPLVNDLGSGTLRDIAPLGLPREPTVAEAVAEGADLVHLFGRQAARRTAGGLRDRPRRPGRALGQTPDEAGDAARQGALGCARGDLARLSPRPRQSDLDCATSFDCGCRGGGRTARAAPCRCARRWVHR